MTYLIFIIILTITGLFCATFILSRYAALSMLERDAWIHGFAYLDENPHDRSGALKVVHDELRGGGVWLKAAHRFKEARRGAKKHD